MSEGKGAKEPTSVPPSFIPSSGRKKTMPSTDSSRSQSAPSQPASFAPAKRTARPSSSVPQSFQPAARATSETRRNPSSSPVSFAPEHTRTANPTQQFRGSSSVSTALRSVPSSPATASVPKRRPRVGRIVLSIFLVLILALGIGVFSAWNWVDDQLNKQTWLTSKADTAGESWLILGSDEREGTIGDAGDVEGFRTDTILVLTKTKTGQKINHVAMVRFGGLVKVVDALGGVDLCYDQNVNDPYSGMNWTAGCHTVDGNTALAFSRMRYADVQGDFGRAARQRQVINAIVKKGASKQTLTNFNKTKKVAAAALSSVTVDEKASTSSLLRMALAFKSASGKDGISGSVYWTDPDYYVDGVGSCVLLDDAKNIQLFSELSHGTHSAGTVGTLDEQQN